MTNIEEASLSKADLIAAFIEKRLADNLAAFKQYIPEIYDVFNEYQEERFFVIYGNDGGVNLVDREKNQLLYGDNPAQEILDNYEAYKKNSIHRPYLCISDGVTGKTNPVHNGFMFQLGQVQRKLLEASAKSTLEGLRQIDWSDPDRLETIQTSTFPTRINSMIWFSVGLGFDLEAMYEEVTIRRLYILEPDKDIFYASLQLMDWAKVLEKMDRENLSIYIGISDQLDDVVDDFSNAVFAGGRHNIAGSYLYSAFFLDEYTKLFESVKNKIDFKIFAGYGFYDDARLSLAHTVGNFKNKVPCISLGNAEEKEQGQAAWSVFVIGNGPSIDDDIEVIRANQHKAFIISCGTSLSTLFNNGIKPDIHVELERTADVTTFLKNTSRSQEFQEYLDDVLFIGMSQVHPGSYEMFKKKGQMPKDTEAGSLLAYKVAGDKRIALVGRAAPSCVHVGVTTAVVLGFRNIFFFGTDMGYLNREYHHSKSSLYENMNDESKEFYTPKAHGEVEFEANFGEGVVFSSGFLPMFKSELENTVKGWRSNLPALNIYNCSNGARIDGADPLLSGDLHIDAPSGKEKAELLDKVFQGFFAYESSDDDVEVFSSALNDAFDVVDGMCDWLVERIEPVSSIEEAENIVTMMAYAFHKDMPLDDENSWLFTLFDGTLLYGLSAVNSILYLPFKEELKVKAFNEAMDEFVEFFNTLKQDFRSRALVYDNEENYNYF